MGKKLVKYKFMKDLPSTVAAGLDEGYLLKDLVALFNSIGAPDATVTFNIDCGYDGDDGEIVDMTVHCERLETDGEYKARLDLERAEKERAVRDKAKAEASQEKRERTLLNTLKAKYENG